MKIYIASDHAGIDLKKTIFDFLVLRNLDVVDLGPENTDRVDYPDYAKKLCNKMLNDDTENMGILICGTGLGMSMAANRFNRIRAAVCTNTTYARLARQHNNANVLCMGARMIGDEMVKEIVDIFLNTGFGFGRHKGRVDKMDTECVNTPDSIDLEQEMEDINNEYEQKLQDLENEEQENV